MSIYCILFCYAIPQKYVYLLFFILLLYYLYMSIYCILFCYLFTVFYFAIYCILFC